MRGFRSMLIAGLAIVLTGCSFAIVDGPRSSRATPGPRCTHSYAAPLIDSALTLIATAVSIEGYRGASDDDDESLGIGLAASGFGVLTLASAVYGFIEVKSCKLAEPEPPDDYLIKDNDGNQRD